MIGRGFPLQHSHQAGRPRAFGWQPSIASKIAVYSKPVGAMRERAAEVWIPLQHTADDSHNALAMQRDDSVSKLRTQILRKCRQGFRP